jgi:hypothetical protein
MRSAGPWSQPEETTPAPISTSHRPWVEVASRRWAEDDGLVLYAAPKGPDRAREPMLIALFDSRDREEAQPARSSHDAVPSQRVCSNLLGLRWAS